MNTNVLCAVFKRNFVNYFANPTGYVFICVFLLLSSCAAFRPSEFFSANLCNLDVLNSAITLILLIFVPAITMGVWADESRQGTDELLLTIPAGDLEIVLGKYLACVAIYSVSLAFSADRELPLSQIGLGDPDVGLFLSNYLGYWFLGLAMLAIGMVASFLTRNLTVAYILGAVLNALVALTWYADLIPTVPYAWAMVVKHWSLGGQFQEFGRGIISLSGIVYFVMIVAIMLYLCMVLIGRRHWIRSGSWLRAGVAFHPPRRRPGSDGRRSGLLPRQPPRAIGCDERTSRARFRRTPTKSSTACARLTRRPRSNGRSASRPSSAPRCPRRTCRPA